MQTIIRFDPQYKLYLGGLLLFLISALFSDGYHHPDEHFQILEFANYKLGKSESADLPWEYHQKIRPALQPTLIWVSSKFLNLIGVNNPFYIIRIIRVLTALLAWFVMFKLSQKLIGDFRTTVGKKAAIVLLFYSWFIPYIVVRFSSENYAFITFLSAVYFILNYENFRVPYQKFSLIAAGVLLGLSFNFRFQMAFAFLGTGAWLIFINKIKLNKLIAILLPSAFTLLCCILIDRWFYGDWVITSANYFNANIIEGKAANWGTSPWWYYFKLFFEQAVPPLSILLILCFFLGLVKKPNDLFAWSTVTFVLGHILLGHKEMRFLFPVAFGFLYIAAIGFEHLLDFNRYKKLVYWSIILSVIVNFSLLLVRTLIPAQEAVKCYEFIQSYSKNKPILIISFKKQVYELSGLRVNYYKSNLVDNRILEEVSDLKPYLEKIKLIEGIILVRDLSTEIEIPGYKAQSVYSPYPLWIRHFNFNNWLSRAEIWNIYEIQKIEP